MKDCGNIEWTKVPKSGKVFELEHSFIYVFSVWKTDHWERRYQLINWSSEDSKRAQEFLRKRALNTYTAHVPWDFRKARWRRPNVHVVSMKDVREFIG